MNTEIQTFDGVPLIVPEGLRFPDPSFAAFGKYCGGGQGLGNDLVPESIFWLKVSPACYIHDVCWDIADPTWAEFHQANSIFFHNLLFIISHRSKGWLLEHLRNYRAVTYYNAVDTVGAAVFWGMKAKQGLEIPEDLRP